MLLGTLFVHILMLLKMSDKMFCVDCVPFGFLDIQFSGVFTFERTRSHVYDEFYLHDLLLVTMYGSLTILHSLCVYFV